MKRFHLIFGFTVLIVFALTGQYMDRYHHHLHGMADGPRMLYRTRHIFILMSGLLHLGVGTYWRDRSGAVPRAMQIIGSLLITTASVLFTIAFFKEPLLTDLQAPLTSKGMYLIAFGTLLHFLSGLGEKKG